MLGPSVMFLGVPVALLCGARALRSAPDRGAAWVAFLVAVAESAVIGYAVFRMATEGV